MTRQVSGRPTAYGMVSLSSMARWVLAAALLVAVVPTPARAQFGMLKKLKKAASGPDSAARATDSLAQIAAGVKPESVKVNKGSLLARGASAVSTANGALESATGISAKDAALAATGVGAGNLLAKKMGVDPMSLGKTAMNQAKLNAQQRAMQKATGASGIASGIAGLAGMPDAASIQAMQQSMATANVARGKVAKGTGAAAMMGVPGMAGFTQADAEALVAFQQEMMQVAMLASTGDEAAKTRLEAWQALTLKHQGEIEKLSLTASAGDVASMQKLQQMQFTIMKEWASTAGPKLRVPKAKRP
jgi:hypothetical protein